MPDQTVVFDDETDPEDELGEDRPPTDAEVVSARKRPRRTARAALSMALAGASNRDIADQLGYASPGTAEAAWQEELAGAYDNEEDYAAFRRLQSGRMNRALQVISPKAFASTLEVPDPKNEGKTKRVVNERQLEWMREFRATVESISKLHGLNAPQVVAMVSPTQKEFEKVINLVADAISGGHEIEGDIFAEEDIVDAEVVEDEK